MSFSFDFGTPDPNAPPPDATQPAAAPAPPPPPPKPAPKPEAKAAAAPAEGPWTKYAPEQPDSTTAAGPWTKYAPPSTGEDIARGAGGGLTAGTTGLVSGPLALGSWLQKKAIVPAAKAVGLETDPDPGGMLARGAANVQQAGEQATKGTYFDPTYQPTTTAGQVAKTAGEFVPGAFIPGGEAGFGSKVLSRVVAPAAGTELGGRAAEAMHLDPATGRLIGGLAGAGIGGAVLPSVTPELAGAAETLGTSLPSAATGGAIPRLAGIGLQKVPVAGAPLSAMASRAGRQATAGVGGALETAGAEAPEVGGTLFKTAADEYNTKTLMPENDAAYKAVTAATGNATNPMSNTAQLSTQIMRDRTGAGLADSPAVNDVMTALTDPAGKTFDQLKTLRTTIGAKIPASVTPVSTDAAEYKQLYGALTSDMDTAAKAAGPDAYSKWQTAETTYKNNLARQEAVAKIVGASGDASGEEVINNIQTMASQAKAGADIANLRLARSTIGDPAWTKIGGSIAQKMGTDPATGDLSLATLQQNYSGLSQAGRDALFPPGTPMRQTLDAVGPVTRSLQGLGKGLSGTTHGVGAGAAFGAAAGEALMSHPMFALKAGLGALPVAGLLSMPTTGSALARFFTAYRNTAIASKLGTGAVEATRAMQGATRDLANAANAAGMPMDPDAVTSALQNQGQQ